MPLAERLDRLHIVVAVDEHRRRGRITGRPVREHGRLARSTVLTLLTALAGLTLLTALAGLTLLTALAGTAGLPDLDDGKACAAQVLRKPFGGGADVAMVCRIRGDRRNGQTLFQPVEELPRVAGDVVTDFHER